MAVQTTTNLSNSVRVQYLRQYIQAANFTRTYDQFSTPIGKDQGEIMSAMERGSSVQANFLSDLAPVTAAISQVVDLTPVTLRDATATISPSSRANAIQWSQQLDIQNYTNYGEGRYKAIGKNMMESVDAMAVDVALAGGNVLRATSRASLDAGASSHRLSETAFAEIETILQVLKCPAYLANGRSQYMACMHPEVFFDLRTSNNVLAVGAYQKSEIILNFELGQLGPFKIIVSPWAKVFGAAGADNASNVDTTLNGAVNALDKTVIVTSATNITSGDYLTIGTEETGNTFQYQNERVRVSAAYVSGTTVNIIGEGPNGGLRFDHTTLTAVRNADSVFPVLYGGPASLAKVYATEVGEYGEVVGPKRQGLADQFASLAWKFYGNYGLWSDSWIVRGEYASSLENN